MDSSPMTAIGAFLATYLIHSTVLAGGALLLGHLWRTAGPQHRELLWKGALLGGIATSLAQTLLPFPTFGGELPLAAARTRHVTAFEGVGVPRSAETARGGEPGRDATVPSPAEAESPVAGAAVPASTAGTGYPPLGEGAVMPSFFRSPLPWSFVVPAWLGIVGLFLARLAAATVQLRRLRRGGTARPPVELTELVGRLTSRMGIRGEVRLVLTDRSPGPMVAGLWCWHLYLPPRLLAELDRDQLEGLVAHELSHLVRRDPWWNLLGSVVCAVFFFQPLNFVLRRRIRREAEFLADTRSAATLADGLGLARCLAALAEWSPRPAPPTAIGASAFRSTLGQRVQRLLTQVEDAPAGEGWRVWLPAALILLSLFLPRATPHAPPLHEEAAMRSPARFSPFTGGLALLAGLAGLPAPAAADDPVAVKAAGEEAAVSEIPESVVGFFAQVTGVVVSTGGEGPLFRVAAIGQVPERANRAAKPEALVGRTVRLRPAPRAPLQERFLARLKPDQEVTVYLRHAERAFFFLAELTEEQRAWAEGAGTERADGATRETRGEQTRGEPDREVRGREVGDPSRVPEGLAGFSGRVVGRLLEKDVEAGRLKLEIHRVDQVWRNSRARNPRLAIGRSLPIEGVSGRFLDVLLTLQEGDGVRIEVKHVAGDGLVFLGEGLERVELEEPAGESSGERPSREPVKEPAEEGTGFPEGLRGFRGILLGEVMETDAEAGRLTFRMTAVKRTWPRNTARNPQAAAGRALRVEGIAGKFTDELLLLSAGDKVEVEAFHLGGDQLSFPGEWLKKIE